MSALPFTVEVLTGNITYMQATKLFMAPLSGALDTIMSILLAWVVGVFIYHTIWQLRLMQRIYTDHTQVHLFEAGPLYAFSRLTARTATGLVLLAYVEIPVLPEEWRTHPGYGGLAHYGLILGIIVVAVVTFVWPLLGVHQLLAAEKEQRQTALAQRMDAAISELQRPLEASELGPVEVTRRKEALDTLVLAVNEVQKISTWPWRTGTVGGLVTTILLPLLLWFITRLLGKMVP
jgi:hypothetical protein